MSESPKIKIYTPLFYNWARRLSAACLCHRAIHGAMAAVYAASCFGLDKLSVGALVAGLYLIQTIRD